MKALALSLALAATALPALAGGPVVSAEDPPQVVVMNGTPSGSVGTGTVVVSLLTLLIVAAAVAK
ncbi:MAG: hypothetical protein JNN06_06585 [Gemmobacter sp.]|uniref:hypothetical protein n=1 Tax=Gemmobacter sp. TaxID=1898957 RepID=UPI001A3C9AB2|nr:hypothetical protein [Gemmobacter sp.]MBL8561930.1 hypothetical protein [Gemmobacter sp.]